MLMIPVILPPGCRKDVTSPASIGSAETANTMGTTHLSKSKEKTWVSREIPREFDEPDR